MRIRRNSGLTLLTMLATAACVAPATSAEGPRAGYVSTVLGASVSTFDAFTGVVGAPIPFPGNTWGVAIVPDGSTAYVADENGDSVTPIDTATNTRGTPIPAGSTPRSIGITPDGATAYVANRSSNNVTPIDTASNTPLPSIPVGNGPHGIAIAPDGESVYVANIFSQDVSVIDTATNSVTATIAAGGRPYNAAITPDGATLYLTTPYTSDVLSIDTATNTANPPISVGGPAYGVAVSPDGATAYVSISNSGAIVPIDTATDTVGPPIPAGVTPEGLAITPDGSTAYVTDVGNNTFTSLDLETGTPGLANPTGQAPMVIAITPNQGPVAAFDASVGDALTATFDAVASHDSDGTISSYAWDFGDGYAETTSGPSASHTYAQPGNYTVTLTVTDDEGCSDAFVFTGQTASCNDSPSGRATQTVTFAGPTAVSPSPTPAPSHDSRQAIERFTLDGPCVRRARDGKARIGLRLLLAEAGPVAIQVDRAVTAKQVGRCPKRKPGRRYTGKLRRVEAVQNVDTRAVTASVRRRLTRSFELRPGLYRIAVRAHDADGGLTRGAYRWVRVIAGRR
ncbi:MAG TPA: PKD domain-containing protein [Thermoleophilaceae bacterium]|nr:PKD domain-containing protein [Thermoleophilaceae bacterium]